MTVEVVVLASGSSGNATLVSAGGTTVLLDAGISTRSLTHRLAQLGRDLAEIDAILVSHEHSDHVRALEVLLKRRPIPVWATSGTWSGLTIRCDGGGVLESGREQRFGALGVLPVATSHDAAEPVAFVIDDGRHRIALCTDTGIVTPLLEIRLTGCDLLCLEANHDADMLRHGPYPWPLKQRIASRSGHLANHQTVETLDRVRHAGLRAVVGMHLSEHNNLPGLVLSELTRAAGEGVAIELGSRSELVRVVLNGDGLTLERRPAVDARRGAESSAGL